MKKTEAWLLCAAWMGVIFIMSGTPGDVSGMQSGFVADLLLAAIRAIAGAEAASAVSVELIGFLVRKAAHMAEYAVLFILYKRALSLSGAKHPGVAALLLSACYAATDEWHQSFVAGRVPGAMDVGIDTLGASIAWGVQEGIKRKNRNERVVGVSRRSVRKDCLISISYIVSHQN